MVCLSVVVLCYRIMCSWFCNKRLCHKEGVICAGPSIGCVRSWNFKKKARQLERGWRAAKWRAGRAASARFPQHRKRGDKHVDTRALTEGSRNGRGGGSRGSRAAAGRVQGEVTRGAGDAGACCLEPSLSVCLW